MSIKYFWFLRQKNLIWNRDQESGIDRIKADIHTLSDGRLDAELAEMSNESIKAGAQLAQPQQKKKKK